MGNTCTVLFGYHNARLTPFTIWNAYNMPLPYGTTVPHTGYQSMQGSVKPVHYYAYIPCTGTHAAGPGCTAMVAYLVLIVIATAI